MNWLEYVREKWLAQMGTCNSDPWFQKLLASELTKEHYISFLKETYHNAGQNPQIQAFATGFMDARYRNLHKKFYQHAISEIGHDLLALSDLQVLGVSADHVKESKPMPQTLGLIAYGYYVARSPVPLGYLGYLFHLEFMPTTGGSTYMNALRNMGVPDEAMTFLEEHATVDVQHNKLMVKYFEELVSTQADADRVAEAAIATCVLHHQMIFGAFAEAEKPVRKVA